MHTSKLATRFTPAPAQQLRSSQMYKTWARRTQVALEAIEEFHRITHAQPPSGRGHVCAPKVYPGLLELETLLCLQKAMDWPERLLSSTLAIDSANTERTERVAELFTLIQKAYEMALDDFLNVVGIDRAHLRKVVH